MMKDTPEGQTHYSCDVALKEGNGCCGCSGHDCPEVGAEGYLKLNPELHDRTTCSICGLKYCGSCAKDKCPHCGCSADFNSCIEIR